MSAPTDLHNLLSARFAREVIGPAVKSGATYAELTTIFESCQLGMLEILTIHYELAPAVATGLCEASFNSAIERFSARRNQEPPHA